MDHKVLHRFNSIAFKENFNLPLIREQLNADLGIVNRKDTIHKPIGAGRVYVFNFGAVTFWNVEPEDQKQDLQVITSTAKTVKTLDKPFDYFYVEVDPQTKPHVEFSKIVVDELTPERAELVAYTVAQSVAMDYYETLVETIWEEANIQILKLKINAKSFLWPNKFHQKIGEVVSIRNAVIGILHLLDRPDLVWEDKLMDSLYGDLRSIFDLPERLQALQAKLETIQDTLEILIDTARDARLFIAEVTIIALFVVDIIISLVQKHP